MRFTVAVAKVSQFILFIFALGPRESVQVFGTFILFLFYFTASCAADEEAVGKQKNKERKLEDEFFVLKSGNKF